MTTGCQQPATYTSSAMTDHEPSPASSSGRPTSATTAPPSIRPFTAADIGRAQEIERDAGLLFLDVDMAEIAEDEPLDHDTLVGYAEADQAWVLVLADEVVGYILADIVDGEAHADQLSITRRVAGHGYGAMLLRHVEAWARHQGLPRLTFTTFRDVPWNAPYYARLGFSEISEDTIGPELAAIVAEERHLDAGQWTRVVMAKQITRSPHHPTDT